MAVRNLFSILQQNPSWISNQFGDHSSFQDGYINRTMRLIAACFFHKSKKHMSWTTKFSTTSGSTSSSCVSSKTVLPTFFPASLDLNTSLKFGSWFADAYFVRRYQGKFWSIFHEFRIQFLVIFCNVVVIRLYKSLDACLRNQMNYHTRITF